MATSEVDDWQWSDRTDSKFKQPFFFLFLSLQHVWVVQHNPLWILCIYFIAHVYCVCAMLHSCLCFVVFRDMFFHILVWFIHLLFPIYTIFWTVWALSHSFIKWYHSDCGRGDPAHYVVCLASMISSRDSPQTPASHWAGGGNKRRGGGVKKSLLHHILKAAGWLRTRSVLLVCRCT